MLFSIESVSTFMQIQAVALPCQTQQCIFSKINAGKNEVNCNKQDDAALNRTKLIFISAPNTLLHCLSVAAALYDVMCKYQIPALTFYQDIMFDLFMPPGYSSFGV